MNISEIAFDGSQYGLLLASLGARLLRYQPVTVIAAVPLKDRCLQGRIARQLLPAVALEQIVDLETPARSLLDPRLVNQGQESDQRHLPGLLAACEIVLASN